MVNESDFSLTPGFSQVESKAPLNSAVSTAWSSQTSVATALKRGVNEIDSSFHFQE
jgi:hypothetical protein